MHSSTEKLRDQILAAFQAGVEAANPYNAVKNCLLRESSTLKIRLDPSNLSKLRVGSWRQIHLIAFGKAACAMAVAAQECLPADILAGKGIIVTNYDNLTALENFELIGAGHPLPDQAGLRAANLIVDRVRGARAGELVLVLVSGGGSALLPAPVAGISLEEKIITTDLLLGCGASINQINCVRKHLSRLKGGGLAKMAAPADLHTLILSDVIGDDLSAIASGPTVADDTRFADAVNILKSYKVWTQVPPAVQNYLLQGTANLQAETPKSGSDIFKNCSHTLIGSNAISLTAVLENCRKYGFNSILYSNHLCGEARNASSMLAAHAARLQKNGIDQATAIIAGGETTVSLSGNGKGGRNQEMALAFALAAEQHNLTGGWVFLSGGTDGRDGPTDAAGGVVDPQSLQRMRLAGLDPNNMLNNNDAYPALKAANDLLMTGATGTNVADLQILLLLPAHVSQVN